jgi:UDP-N-acetylglucosamine--N-acetylmuramyl-(pentapeptide) pyrophosphoryl-undecaprenol N-acetylglucosamine transferase
VKILVVTGASGGHIFPALSFLDTLRDKYKAIDTLLVLPKRNMVTTILPDKYKVKYISILPLELKFSPKHLLAILMFLRGALESLILLLRFRPDIVVGFGGIDCIPLVMFAWAFRTKTLIHEQNVIPGKANRLLAKFVDKTAVSFAVTENYLGINCNKITLTGNPRRPDLKRVDRKKALSFFGFDDNKFTILVMGGSQGSHSINSCFPEAVSMMRNNQRLQIIHITGTRDYAALSNSYKNIDVDIRLFDFLSQIQYAYSISEFAVCRAGATTIGELIFFRLPAIIIPYPFAYKHQLSNAQVLEKTSSCVVINDHELNAKILSQTMEELMDNPERLENMRSGYNTLSEVDANEALVNAVMSLQSIS